MNLVALSKSVVLVFQQYTQWLIDVVDSHVERIWKENAGALQAFGETADRMRRDIVARVQSRNRVFVRRFVDTQHFSVWYNNYCDFGFLNYFLLILQLSLNQI